MEGTRAVDIEHPNSFPSRGKPGNGQPIEATSISVHSSQRETLRKVEFARRQQVIGGSPRCEHEMRSRNSPVTS